MMQRLLMLLLSVPLITWGLEQAHTQGPPSSETRVEGASVEQSETFRHENSEEPAEVSGEGTKSNGHPCNCRQRNDSVKTSCLCPRPKTRKIKQKRLTKSEIKDCQRKRIRNVVICRKLRADRVPTAEPILRIPIPI